MQHVEAVLDVVAPLLFGMDVARPPLAVGSAMLLLLVEFVANSARTRTSFAEPGCVANGRHGCIAIEHRIGR